MYVCILYLTLVILNSVIKLCYKLIYTNKMLKEQKVTKLKIALITRRVKINKLTYKINEYNETI